MAPLNTPGDTSRDILADPATPPPWWIAPVIAPPAGTVPAGTVPAATPAPVVPGAPKPFKEIIKGAKEIPGSGNVVARFVPEVGKSQQREVG